MASRLQDVLLVGIRADQPLATDVANGTIYSVSDENYLLEQSDGSAWVQWGPTAIGGALTNIRVSAGTTSNLLSALTFSNGSNVSFGLNASVITASVASSLTNIKISAGLSSTNLSALTFADLNGVSFGLNGSVITASHNGLTVQSNLAFSAQGGSSTFQTLGFSNNVFGSFTNTNGSVALAGINASLFAVSNTTQATSGTQNLSALSFQGAGGVSVGVSNGSVVISGNTAAGGGGGSVSNWNNWYNFTTFANNQNNTRASIQLINLPEAVVFSNVQMYFSFDVTTVNNSSSAYMDLSISGVFYTRNGSTLNALTSFSNTMFQTWTSNNTSHVTGIIGVSATLPTVTLTAGSYWLAAHISTTNTATGAVGSTTALAHAITGIAIRNAASSFYVYRNWGVAPNDSVGIIPGQGILSTNATMASIDMNGMSVSGTRAFQGAVALELRNQTFQ